MKSSCLAVAVVLAMSGTTPVAADSIRLAQTFAADVIPPYEVFTIIRSVGLRPLGRPHHRGRFYIVNAVDARGEEVRVVVDAYAARVVSIRPLDRQTAAEYDYPPVYRRNDFGSPPAPGPRMIEADPRYLPPAPVPRPGAPEPRYGGPQILPDDDDDYTGEGSDEFDIDEDDRTGSLPPRAAPRATGLTRTPDAPASRPASAQQKAPLPRPRPQMQASAAPPEGRASEQTVSPDIPAGHSPAGETKDGAVAPAGKSDSKTEARSEAAKPETPKGGIRIIEIKRPEPRI